MQLKRIRCLLSPNRLRACFGYFQDPWRAFFHTAALRKAPYTLTLKSGQSLSFSRDARDHKLWDWLLASRTPIVFSFTASGQVQIDWDSGSYRLRPGTQDALIFQEILVDDVLRHQADPHTTEDRN